MADKNIGALPVAPGVNDDSLLAVEQQGVAMKMTGRQFRSFGEAAAQKIAQETAAPYAQAAKEAAGRAASDSAAARTAAETAAERAASAEADAADAALSARSAEQYSGKPPEIRGGTWWRWNALTQAYEDTGSPSRGERGEQGVPGPEGKQGVQGPPGPRGIDGVAVAAEGQYAFNVNEDGDLILSYTGAEAPDYYIAEDGTLRMRMI